jgi:NAD-dependent SIR2 family protein deacetylase
LSQKVLKSAKHIATICGAGLSAESGIPVSLYNIYIKKNGE